MDQLDKQALLALRPTVDTVELDGAGHVTVRGLTRLEMRLVFDREDRPLQQEQLALSFGMVDPAMTEEDAADWQSIGAHTHIEAVARKINELSGIGRGAAKSVVPEDGERPGD